MKAKRDRIALQIPEEMMVKLREEAEERYISVNTLITLKLEEAIARSSRSASQIRQCVS